MAAVEHRTTRHWSGWPWSGPEIAVCCGTESATRHALTPADNNQLPAHLVIRAIGHDLQQPLHAMRMLIQELRQAPSRLVLARLADELQAGLEAMGNQLAFVIDGAQLDSGAHAPEQIPLPLQPLLERILSENLCSARRKNLDFRCRPSSCWALADPMLLHSVISNLVVNAIRYTDKGRVLIGVRRSRNMLRIEVWDSGRGIAEAELPRIFMDNYRVRHAGMDAVGVGFGLNLVLRIARLISSDVAVRSAPGRGSRFSIRIPMASRGSSRRSLPRA
jgi:two-component system, sensor histidine kinase